MNTSRCTAHRFAAITLGDSLHHLKGGVRKEVTGALTLGLQMVECMLLLVPGLAMRQRAPTYCNGNGSPRPAL